MPKVNTDPIMSLAPWSVEVTLSTDKSAEIQPQPAIEWLQYLFSSSPDFDRLVTEMMPEIEDYFFENDLSLYDLYELALEVVTAVSARPWWITFRLISVVRDNWNVLGPKMIMNNIDSGKVSLSAWLDVALFLIIENMDPKDVTMFTLRLEMPPPNLFGKEVETKELEMDRGAFLAFAD